MIRSCVKCAPSRRHTRWRLSSLCSTIVTERTNWKVHPNDAVASQLQELHCSQKSNRINFAKSRIILCSTFDYVQRWREARQNIHNYMTIYQAYWVCIFILNAVHSHYCLRTSYFLILSFVFRLQCAPISLCMLVILMPEEIFACFLSVDIDKVCVVSFRRTIHWNRTKKNVSSNLLCPDGIQESDRNAIVFPYLGWSASWEGNRPTWGLHVYFQSPDNNTLQEKNAHFLQQKY